MKAYIKAIAYHLPERVVTNDDLAEEFQEWTAEKISSKIGVNERHVAGDNETATDLAYLAAEKLFAENDAIKRESIDFVLLCTQSSDYFLPSSACILQHKLGLPTACGAYDFNLGCSGYEYGLATAKGYIAAGIARNVLLLTAETYNKYIHQRDKGNRTIFGDAATATLVSTDGFAEIGEFSLGTDGSGADKLIVKTGAARQKQVANDMHIDDNGVPVSSDHLYMDGGGIFNFSAEAVPAMVADVLEKNNMDRDDVDLFVFHQANKYMINYLRKLMDIDRDKFYIYMEKVGNTVSSTIPIALYEAKKEERLHGKILLAGFGVGLSWGATIINAE